jgi:S-disulfanyl-L-cysteine oxidoreductase SoxD
MIRQLDGVGTRAAVDGTGVKAVRVEGGEEKPESERGRDNPASPRRNHANKHRVGRVPRQRRPLAVADPINHCSRACVALYWPVRYTAEPTTMISSNSRMHASVNSLHRGALAAAVSAFIVFVSPSPLVAQDSTPPAPVVDKSAAGGAFTDVQAKRGDETYKAYCVACHSAKEYTGDAFKSKWLTRTAFEIFDLIKSKMPDDNPGSLARTEYADIVAYLLSLNGYPTGADELPSEDEPLKHVKIDSLPKPPQTHGAWSALLLRRQLKN